MSEVATHPPASDQRGELIGRLKSKLKEYVTRLKTFEAERATLATERDAAVARAGKAEADFNVEPLKGEVDRLKGEIRAGKHKTAFEKAAIKAGAPEDAVDLLWRESGWKADKDDVDAEALSVAVGTLKARPDLARLFGEAPAPETPAERRAAPARGQGQRVGEGDRVKATSAQIRDPDWCYQNREALRERRVDQVD